MFRSLAILLGALVSGLSVVAQSPPVTAAGLRSATGLAAAGDHLQAIGHAYSARIDQDGLRYEPGLGAAAPAAQHLALSLVEIRRGDQVVWRKGTPSAPVQTGARRAELPHGICRERHDVTPEGIELSLEFPAPLPGHGDLVASFHCATSLPVVERQGAGAVFLLPGVGGVSIGGVTGIDAHGTNTAGSLQVVGDRLELRLPGAFVEHAAWPLILDPLVGTQFLASTAASVDSQPAVAYEASNDAYLVAYRYTGAAGSMQIRGCFVTGAGTPQGSMVVLATAPWLDAPKVANIAPHDTFVVAWLEAATPFGTTDVRVRTVRSQFGAPGSLGTATTVAAFTSCFDLAAGSTTNNRALLLLGNATGGGNAEVLLMQLSVAGPTATPLIESSTVVQALGTPVPHVAISANATLGHHMLAWIASNTLWTGTCGPTGALLAVPFGVDGGGNGYLPRAVDVDGAPAGNGEAAYLIAYEYDNQTTLDRDVWLARQFVYADGSQVFLGYAELDVTPGTVQMQPAIAWCGYKFVALWASQLLQGGGFDVRGSEWWSDMTRCGVTFSLLGVNQTISRSQEIQPAVVGKAASGGVGGDGLILFTEADDGPPFATDLVASRYTALGTGGAIIRQGSNCGTPGTIGTNGPAALGNTDFRITLTGAPPGGVPFLLWSLPGGETTCGACSLSNTLSAEFVVPIGGAASSPFPLPCSFTAYLGVTLQTQWAVLASGQSPCAGFPGLNLSFTQRQRFTLGN
ncbi:MAG: hypothetical protein IPK26_04405 [Planctomycetes bacterium]|nr:hypothetical protein [Planctomycetota bacterium]